MRHLGCFHILAIVKNAMMNIDFIFLHDSVSEDCMFLGIYPFLIGSLTWHIIVHSFLYDPLYLCGTSSNFILSHLRFYLFGVSHFVLMSLAKGLSILFIFSKKFHWSFLIFAISISFIFTLIFIISFLQLTLSIVLLFIVALNVKLDCLFE